MPHNAADRLVAFVLTAAEQEPLAKRAQIYRDTAEVLSDAEHAPVINALADKLDAMNRECHQLTLDFQRRVL